MTNVHLIDSVSEKIDRDVREHNRTLEGVMLGIAVILVSGYWLYFTGFKSFNPVIFALFGVFLIWLSLRSHKSNYKKYISNK